MENIMWKRCREFHGHECGGLTIGYKAALYAIRLLKLREEKEDEQTVGLSPDEEIVCIAENDACGVDAIQVILGCSVGKGNLLFHMRGKQAFSFYNRKTGASVRLVLRPGPKGMTREESFAWYQGLEPEKMFDVKETGIALPEKARIFQSVPCSYCGETTSENQMRLCNGKLLCLDCCETYDRFHV